MPATAHPQAYAALLAIPPERRVGVAFSGGADSSLALSLAAQILGQKRVVALHYHHGVRGPEADADAEHCDAVCAGLGIPCIIGRRHSGTAPTETNLRADRLRFFSEQTREHRLAAIITGHHADDIAETLLLRIARGSGAAGLASLRPVGRGPDGLTFIRILLHHTKADIIEALHSRGMSWREDATNLNPDFADRNALRSSVIPAWKTAVTHDPVRGAIRTRTLIQEDDEALESWADQSEPLLDPDSESENWRNITNLPRAVVRRLLHRRLNRIIPRTPLSSVAFESLLDAVMSGTPHHTPCGDKPLHFDGYALRLKTNPTPAQELAPALIPLPGTVFWPCGATLTATRSQEAPPEPGAHSLRIPADFATTLEAASRTPGASYRQSGSAGSAKIQDMMVNRKIPAHLRPGLPVVSDKLGPLWAPGLIPSARIPKSISGTPAFQLTWMSPRAPWPVPPQVRNT